jgi:hypothetical protein
MDDPATPPRYQIRVRGRLGETLLGAFPGLRAEAHGGETVLAGALADQAALYGVLVQLESLGIELLEVRKEVSDERSDLPARGAVVHGDHRNTTP